MKETELIRLKSTTDGPYDIPAPDNPYWDVDSIYGVDEGTKKYGVLHTIDFTAIPNESLRAEVIIWFYSLITDKEITKQKLNEYISKTEPLVTFILMYKPDILSVLEIDSYDFIPLYENWIEQIGRANTPVNVTRINEKMQKIIYEYEGIYTTVFKRFYKYIADLCDPTTLLPEKDKDRWDIRNLPFPRPRYTVSFEKISQDWLKMVVKEYSYIRLRTKTYSTVIDDMKGFNLFSKFLAEEKSSITSIEDITRSDFEDYIAYVSSIGFAPPPHNQRISSVIKFCHDERCVYQLCGIVLRSRLFAEARYITDLFY